MGDVIQDIGQALIEKRVCESVSKCVRVSGGDINEAFMCHTNKGVVFVKANRSHNAPAMFSAEAEGLKAINSAVPSFAPTPIVTGSLRMGGGFFAMTSLNLSGRGGPAGQARLGEKLAQMHQFKSPTGKFGFHVHNTIGSTPQDNTWEDDWVTFYRDRRLGPMIELVCSRFSDPEVRQLADKLCSGMGKLFEGIKVEPVLLHGDLWAGNAGYVNAPSAGPAGEPVIFDPAAYYGHSEADLGIMKMFGGFSAACFNAYHNIIPQNPAFQRRMEFYQLYHYLNHYYMFGSSYRSQCLHLLSRLVSYVS
ncbi:Fructosamine/Ketosamine-3-kinase [Cladochytrium replicatum]|nr:Fructosamine/Ketosamine-3-kinase [Cladochytrium replicatum]